MNNLLAFLFCGLVSMATAVAETLDASDVDRLKDEITAMYAAFERGDAKPMLLKTHSSLYRVAGGKDAFEKATNQAVEQLLSSGIKIVSAKLGTPTQTFTAGDDEVCFVPRVSLMEIKGRQAKSTSFMIAIRKRNAKEWKYLDGAGLRKNPDLLYVLLPELERGIILPPNKVEAL